MQKQTPGKHRWRARLTRFISLVAFAYLAACVIVFFFQTRLIYHPAKGCTLTPKDIGLDYAELSLPTEDGLMISAWHIPRVGATHTLLYCHGNAGNLSDRLVHLAELHELGFNVLAFDYRGFGNSEGRPTERGTYLDATAAWRYLVDERACAPSSIVIYGRSLGGAVAIELASRHEPAALIVDATFTSLADVAAHHFTLLPVRVLLRHHYDSISRIGDIPCPKLFLHGRLDDVVPFELGRRLFEAANEPKRFVAARGGHMSPGLTRTSRSPDATDATEEWFTFLRILPDADVR